LASLLRDRKLRPKTIIIRDYQANDSFVTHASDNSHGTEPEVVYTRRLIASSAPWGTDPDTVAAMAREVLRDANLSVTSLSIGPPAESWPIGEQRELYMAFGMAPWTLSVGSPRVVEVRVGLEMTGGDGCDCDCDWQQGCGTGFAELREAELVVKEGDAGEWWLGKVFYEARALKSLKLGDSSLGAMPLVASRVVPKLRKLELFRLSSISMGQISAMLANSGESLSRLSLVSVELDEDSSWEGLLSLIAQDCKALISVRLAALTGHGKDDSETRLDFHKVVGRIPPEFESGVDFRARAPEQRVMGLSYKGPDAAGFLGFLSGFVDLLTWEEIEERRARVVAQAGGDGGAA